MHKDEEIFNKYIEGSSLITQSAQRNDQNAACGGVGILLEKKSWKCSCWSEKPNSQIQWQLHHRSNSKLFSSKRAQKRPKNITQKWSMQ